MGLTQEFYCSRTGTLVPRTHEVISQPRPDKISVYGDIGARLVGQVIRWQKGIHFTVTTIDEIAISPLRKRGLSIIKEDRQLGILRKSYFCRKGKLTSVGQRHYKRGLSN